MDKIFIIGSGASGVHFALSLLQKGYDVTMLDVGHKKAGEVNPEDTFMDLKNNLHDPVKYFLGQNYESVIYPDGKAEYYGFPPSKDYIFHAPSKFSVRSNGFSPLFSFSQGGLAEAWTGGVYPFNDHEIEDFPFCYNDIEPYYSEVANRIGVMGVKDDLVRFFPMHENIMEPIDMDRHSDLLLSEYEKHKSYLNHTLKCYLGRSRVAALSRDKEGRKGCNYCGRCLWGCPSQALYTPVITLNQCMKYRNFKYIPDMYVSHFEFDSKRKVTGVVAESIHNEETYEFPLSRLVLAAGTLSSSRIFMESIFRNSGEIIKLSGLMDNRQVLIPFVNLNLVGKPYNPHSYQYHQIAMGIECERPKEYIHGQITTLKTALIHPIIQAMPLDLKTSISIFRNLHAALGIANVNFRDTRREANYLTLEVDRRLKHPRLVIEYSPPLNEQPAIKEPLKRVTKALHKLQCIAPSGMSHIRPMGASVHYAGTIPMSGKKDPLTASAFCQSHDFDNLYMIDGTTFPFLPAKNITFTLMANAVRVAECAF